MESFALCLCLFEFSLPITFEIDSVCEYEPCLRREHAWLQKISDFILSFTVDPLVDLQTCCFIRAFEIDLIEPGAIIDFNLLEEIRNQCRALLCPKGIGD